jgi:hypothetical protein
MARLNRHLESFKEDNPKLNELFDRVQRGPHNPALSERAAGHLKNVGSDAISILEIITELQQLGYDLNKINFQSE